MCYKKEKEIKEDARCEMDNSKDAFDGRDVSCIGWMWIIYSIQADHPR